MYIYMLLCLQLCTVVKPMNQFPMVSVEETQCAFNSYRLQVVNSRVHTIRTFLAAVVPSFLRSLSSFSKKLGFGFPDSRIPPDDTTWLKIHWGRGVKIWLHRIFVAVYKPVTPGWGYLVRGVEGYFGLPGCFTGLYALTHPSHPIEAKGLLAKMKLIRRYQLSDLGEVNLAL